MTHNKQIHIISHTHWDREWYMPYENHHMRLVDLMDDLLETLKTHPGFKSFHLDGQTIILEDYLQVRPDKREDLKQFIQEGMIHIGPWYILQDEFLTSSESNVRNLQYGMKDAKQWGNVSKVGYFPDSFGNIGQAPQLLRQAGINNAIFGRGVKPTGFNNTVIESDNFESPYSEMYWRSPDGSKVYGVLFANWYCNGNEVPVDKQEAKAYWSSRMEGLEKFASSPHMLVMNGCDHQPIQKDLPEAIKTAQMLYPDVTFKHSNFNDYIESLVGALPQNLKTVDGELRSQQTDGWGTLVNTASSRVYLKQMNRTGETMLAKVAEPLASFAYMLGKSYNHHKFEYAWKKLMQNHPHDSICGCSVDEVHRNMVTRFADSLHVAEALIEESSAAITEQINTTQFGEGEVLPFVVFNTTGYERTGTLSVTLNVKREYFSEGVNQDNLKTFEISNKKLVDSDGYEYDFEMEDLGIMFGYDLPNDKFRQPFMARQAKITFEAQNIPALGYKTFALIPVEEKKKCEPTSTLIIGTNTMANDHLEVKIASNGSLSITDKSTGRTYRGLGIYEDTGDIGNEYMFKQPENETPLTTEQIPAHIQVIEDTSFRATYEIIHEWAIPKSATDLLDREQKELVQFNMRRAARKEETVPFIIKTYVSLEKNGKGVQVKTTFNNQAKDHRLRVLFPTMIDTNEHYADSIFEVVKRPNEPSAEWINPDNSQHQQDFVSIGNEEEGLTIANYGLNEYEVLRDGQNTIAVTLLRSVGEMGDWGYFPTPEAQCLGEYTVSFAIYPHRGDATDSYRQAYQYQVPWTTSQAPIQDGALAPEGSFVEWQGDKLAFSSARVSEATGDIMLRWFHLYDKKDTLQIKLPYSTSAYKSNVIEEQEETLSLDVNGKINVPVSGHEIITVGYSL
ncbi:alpha-mannosidase [Lentibacillus saliphilus]|uniref:alpha-mannosidase n=1 Tax=Lentibacillus saliphilus TaxID=2737028 RepID=UPI001C2F9A40|nr:alpha-mannosidase [Lentibacillus saliphilus]